MNSERLDGWKEIADFLGRDVRTAIRWERERGLPVHRLPGGKRSGVFALKHEIDAWLLRHESAAAPAAEPMPRPSVPQSPRPRRWPAAVASAGAILALVVWTVSAVGGRDAGTRVAGIELEGTRLSALGETGRPLWSHDFGRPVAPVNDPRPGDVPRTFAVVDDAPASAPALFVSVSFGDPDGAQTLVDELVAFSEGGRQLWSVALDDTIRFGAGRFGPPWRRASTATAHGTAVTLFRAGDELRIAWAQSHHTWWPAIVSVLDTSGRVLSRWVHSGHVWAMQALPAPGGDLLLVGGISNSREAAFLAALDTRDVTGSGPEAPGSPFECRDCPPRLPQKYLTFPASELILSFGPYNILLAIRPQAGGFEVRTKESEDDSLAVEGVHRFSTDFRLQHSAWSSAWAAVHRKLERARRLDHTLERCDAPSVPGAREWTGDGWRELWPEDLPRGAREVGASR